MARTAVNKAISIQVDLLDRVGKLVDIKPYGNFSQYLQRLIERDLAEREAARREELKAS